MKLFSFLLPLAFILTSHNALSASEVKATGKVKGVEKIETIREGNLQNVALNFYTDKIFKTNPERCDVTGPAAYQFRSLKISSSSHSLRESNEINFQGVYLITEACFIRSTQSGIYRENLKNVFILCSRVVDWNYTKLEKDSCEVIQNLKIINPK